ncbi:MAG TPA: GPW/gp25 family protein [Acidimicrobiales bacterium]|nr:GPW/gp25 family protein [Acidimicrobiales bacterium]
MSDVSSDANTFIGKGLSFPLRVDHTGSIALVGGPEDIDRSLVMVLSTAKGERLMRPEFGCAIWEQLFEPINANTLGLMAQAVRDAVSQWEPRVELEDVTTEADESGHGRVLIGITYRVRATNDRRNLVYPFYTIPGEQD